MTPSPYGTFPKYHPFWYRHPSLKQWFFFQFVHWHGFLRLPQVWVRHSFHHHPEHGLGQYLDLLLKQDIKPLPGTSRCPFFSFQEVMSQGAPLAEAALAMFSIAIFFSYALQVGSLIAWHDGTSSHLTFFPPSSTLSWTSWDPMSSDQTCPQKGFVTCQL